MSSADSLVFYTVTIGSLSEFLAKHLSQFHDAGGVVLFLYSLVMTRGVARVKQDMVVGVCGTSFHLSTVTRQIQAPLLLEIGAFVVKLSLICVLLELPYLVLTTTSWLITRAR